MAQAQGNRTKTTFTSNIANMSLSHLLELMIALGSYREGLVLVGGWVPYLLLRQYQRTNIDFRHVGSKDIDIAVLTLMGIIGSILIAVYGALVAGIIILIITLVFAVFSKPTNSSVNSESNDKTTADLFINSHQGNEPKSNGNDDITPITIKQNLDRVPPGQRKKVAESYRGVEVSWDVNFADIHDHENKRYIITGYPTGNSIPLQVNGYITKTAYPELNVIEYNKKITLTGTIEAADDNLGSIRLKISSININ